MSCAFPRQFCNLVGLVGLVGVLAPCYCNCHSFTYRTYLNASPPFLSTPPFHSSISPFHFSRLSTLYLIARQSFTKSKAKFTTKNTVTPKRKKNTCCKKKYLVLNFTHLPIDVGLSENIPGKLKPSPEAFRQASSQRPWANGSTSVSKRV